MSNKKKLSDLKNAAPVRARIPKNDEFIGLVEKRLGGSRMIIKKIDGGEIMARVPGRAKKYLWIREGDVVLLQPWELDKDRADLVYKYKPAELKILTKKGFDVSFENIEEF